MTGDGWRGFDVAAFNARSARSREREATGAHRAPVVDACKPAPVAPLQAAPQGVSNAARHGVPCGAAPLTLVLPFPPSTNHDKGGGYHLTPDTRAFRRAVADVVRARRAHAVTGRLAVSISLYPSPSRRAFDLDNRVKPMLDALQHAGAFANDEAVDYLYVFRVYGVAADVASERCIVTLTTLEPLP
jgi:Holliday junction resolvase RusA-like endonuclease